MKNYHHSEFTQVMGLMALLVMLFHVIVALCTMEAKYLVQGFVAAVLFIILSAGIELSIVLFMKVKRWWTNTAQTAIAFWNFNDEYHGNITKNPIKKATSSFLLNANERRKPPRALAFGRIDGQDYEIEGDLEEGWLNHYEYLAWYRRKERDKAIKDGILDEKPKPEGNEVQIATKIDYKV